MSMDDILEQRRAAIPGCEALAYGDAATRLILRASHAKSMRREHLDELCDRATDGFALLDAVCMATPSIAEPAQCNQTAWLTPQHSTVFVRTDPQTSEFLCIMCRIGVEVEPLFAAARETLDQVR